MRPIEDIKEMDDDSEEIYTTGLLKRYCKRPPKLENLTLADWAAWYDNCSSEPYVEETQLAFLQLMKNSKSQKNLKSCQLLQNSAINHMFPHL